tara:strand:+ start:174 stop:470 length:297 start_codon:yes stop_codon:yes gene_type:complete
MTEYTKKKKKKKKIDKFPPDFEGFAKSGEIEKARKKALTTLKLAKQHPVEREDAGLNFLMGSGKREVEAYKKYIKDRADIREKARSNKKKYGTNNLLK